MRNQDMILNRRQVLEGATVAGAAALAGCVGGDTSGGGGGDFAGETLNVLSWAGYEGIAKRIEEQTGATVNLKLISSDVDGFNTLQGGGTQQFDILLLDNTWALRNARADTIIPVEKDDYPSTNNWIDQFKWPYPTFTHEDNMYAVPPRWGWGGLGYNDNEVDVSVLEEKGYEAVWDGTFEGEVTLADWPTWVIPLVIMQIFDIGDNNPMDIELSDSQLETLEETLVQMFNNAVAIHGGAAAFRQDMLQGNANLVFGTGNFGLSQIRAEGNDWMKIMYPPDVGGWYWTEGLCLVNNPNLSRDLANEYINACMTPEGQYSICWEDASSKGAPVNTEAFDQFSEEEQKKIMMYEDKGFEATDTLLQNLVQYKISPQQDKWLDIWSSAKASSGI
ncbi:PotD/PotF family extracellular solute-binding protein [Natribaculum luteum]|uniref:PotD/PotF family extracellular solute-binding protein n=1 Tax=Natribaculum luteum TaxID=1586232 RepID=A0ABD5P4B4_9EURY|nr:PotD/PotF family extracellular solute-binding protein [Natribaculum luteum]